MKEKKWCFSCGEWHDRTREYNGRYFCIECLDNFILIAHNVGVYKDSRILHKMWKWVKKI